MDRFRRRVSALVVVTLLAVSPSLSIAAADRQSETTASRTVGVATIDIGNFGRINERYYRGEQPEGRDYADLAALGVRTVIDLQADGENYDEQQLVEAAGMAFVRIPMTTHEPPTQRQLAQFLAIVNDPAQQPVYVHCKGGKHRTGVMSAVYRMEKDGWTADRAFKEMKHYKFGLDILHPELKRFVYAYEPGQVAVAAGAATQGGTQ